MEFRTRDFYLALRVSQAEKIEVSADKAENSAKKTVDSRVENAENDAVDSRVVKKEMRGRTGN